MRRFLTRTLTIWVGIQLLAWSGLTNAQNLVPNPSLETFTFCPFSTADFDGYVRDWHSATFASPDYYNACVTNACRVDVPTNFFGSQTARTGGAYAGIIGYSPTSDGREYIQVQLTQPLVAGQYVVSFFVSLADGSNWSIQHIGAYLSQTQVTGANALPSPVLGTGPIPVVPQYEHGVSFLDDTANWVQLTGPVTATGGEDWLVIGNFRSTALTPVQASTGSSCGAHGFAYYYVDDVSLERPQISSGYCVTGISTGASYAWGLDLEPDAAINAGDPHNNNVINLVPSGGNSTALAAALVNEINIDLDSVTNGVTAVIQSVNHCFTITTPGTDHNLFVGPPNSMGPPNTSASCLVTSTGCTYNPTITKDCNLAEAAVYPGAPEINDGLDNQCPGENNAGQVDEIVGEVVMSLAEEMSWPAQVGATSYEIARSNSPDFAPSCALISSPTPSWTDPSPLAVGEMGFYLIRAAAPFVGSWGLSNPTALVERSFTCPAV